MRLNQIYKLLMSQIVERLKKCNCFFVGDGMGTAARDAIRLATVGVNGKLAMEDMPYAGMARTASGSSFVTDSAAAATAIASGVKKL
ncbi:hypothetical protein GCM10020331_005450 [Ectobacillus funiculus]